MYMAAAKSTRRSQIKRNGRLYVKLPKTSPKKAKFDAMTRGGKYAAKEVDIRRIPHNKRSGLPESELKLITIGSLPFHLIAKDNARARGRKNKIKFQLSIHSHSTQSERLHSLP